MPNPFLESKVLLGLLIAATLGFVWILLPFWGSLMWATIIALLFAPVHRRLLARWPDRPNLSALLTLSLVLLIVILPFVAMVTALARETGLFYGKLQSGEVNPEQFFQSAFTALPEIVTRQLERLGLVDFDALRRTLTAALSRAGQFMATQALSIGQNTVEFVASLFITTYLAYFLIRDGDELSRTLRRAVPLAPAHRDELVLKFTTVIRATVKGNLLVAAIQGALGGLAFWFLDVSGALLWAVVMGLLSMLPAVGAALVWVPVAIYFLVAGEIWQGVSLAAWGVLVIGLVDNLLRPILVGRDTRLPDYVILVSTLGGMAVFGINGFVLGPVIAAMFIAVWHIRLSAEAPVGRRR